MTTHIPEDDDGSLDQWIELHNQKEDQPVYYPRTERRQRWAIVALTILLVTTCTFAAFKANAQTEPSLSFTVETTASASGVVPKLTWSSTPAAISCTASGDAAWSGTKAASGALTLAVITPPKSYTLKCSWPGDAQAIVRWTPPTQNTDNSTLTDLAGYRVNWGASASTLTQVAQVPNAAATSYTVTSLTPGTWYFAVKAYTTAGVESALSSVASKVISAPVELTQTVGIKQPNPPTLVTAN